MHTLDLVIVGDLHYTGRSGSARAIPGLVPPLGLECAVRALRDAVRDGRPDAVILLGDLVDQGSTTEAIENWREIHQRLRAFGVPLVVTPGNHDERPETLMRVFGSRTGIQEINGYLLAVFHESYEVGTEVPLRSLTQMAELGAVRGSGKPIIAVQHPVVWPPLNRDYPYTLRQADRVAEAYADAGVCLSLSGHFHAGLEPIVHRGVTYLVCPALPQRPFVYTRVKLVGSTVASISRVALALEGHPHIQDFHIHTEFAYCAEDITMAEVLNRLPLLGLSCVGFVEHADQLYLPREGFWARRDMHDPAALCAARDAGHARYRAFRNAVRPLCTRPPFLGLEAEPASDGRGLAVLPEDRDGPDYWIGAIHHFGPLDVRRLTAREREDLFLRGVRQVVAAGVHILAHPFRYFPKELGIPEPENLYRPVVEYLAETGTAAEINFHTYAPRPEFYALCLKRGVRLTLGSDAHALVDVGDLHPHLDLLKEIGAWGRLDEALWRPHR